MFFKKLNFSFACLLALGAAPGMAQASLVVDTGTPSNAAGSGWAFNSSHSYAGQFSALSDLTINSIQGYFNPDVGNVSISLFGNSDDGDGGFIPGSLMRSTSIATSVGALAWKGASALNWEVAQGTYWVVFAASYSSANQSSMPGMAANPLSDYALKQNGQWYDATDVALNQGLRVDATAHVPEPGSMALFGLGMIGVGVLRRRRQG